MAEKKAGQGQTKERTSRAKQWLTYGCRLFLVSLTLWAGLNFGRALRLPEVTEEVSNVQNLACRTSFSFQVLPAPSLLYPEAKPLEEGKVFFTKVTRDVEVKFTTLLEADPALALSGTYEVWLVLEAPELWRRDYILQEAKRFTGEKGRPVELSGAYRLDFEKRVAFLKGVEEETGVSPRDGYSLILRPVIRLEGDLPAGAKREFTPEFGFNVKYYQFSPLANPKQDDEQHLTAKTLRPTAVPVYRWSLPVAKARFLFGILTLPGLIAGSWWLRKRLRMAGERRKACEGAYINRRYHSRIIRVESTNGIPGDRPILRMKTFAELLRIADEREKPIILVQTSDKLAITNFYYVLDEANLFSYVTSEPLQYRGRSLTGGVAAQG